MIVLLVIPVIFRYNYQDISSFKVMLYLLVSGIFLILSLIIVIGTFVQKRQWGIPMRTPGEMLQTISMLDWGILIFGVISLFSSFTTRYGAVKSLLASESVFVGGALLFMLMISYFIISRYADPDRTGWVRGFYISSFIVVLLGILNHIGIDPLGMHKNNASTTILTMASTIGNVDFLYGYLSLITIFFCAYRMGMERDKKIYIVDGLLLLCFMATWSARASAVFTGLFFGVLILFYMALGSFDRMKNLFWIGLLSGVGGVIDKLLAIAGVGIYNTLYKEISQRLNKHYVYLIIGIFCLIMYLILGNLEKRGKKDAIEKAMKAARLPYAVVVSVLAAILMFSIVYFPFFRENAQRTVVWDGAFQIFREGDFREKLIGVGPGSIDAAKDRLDIVMNNGLRMETAHNELIEYCVTTGILGIVSYLMIMAGVFSSYYRKKPGDEKEWEMGCAAALYAAFIGQGLTNGPNPVPVIVAFTFAALFRRYQIPVEENELF